MADLYALQLTVDPSGIVSGSATAGASLKRLGEQARKTGTDGAQGLDPLASSLGRLKGLIVGALAGYSVTKFIADSGKASAAVERLDATTRQMATNMGYGSAAIETAEKALRAGGLTALEAAQGLNKMVRAGVDLAQSQQLAAAANNEAARTGEDAGAVFEQYLKAIQTGVDRGLKMNGILLDFEGALKSAAQAQGRSVESFTQQELMAIRMEAALRSSANTAGTFEKAMESNGQVVDEMADAYSNITVAAGKAFGPMIHGALRSTLDWMNKVAEALEDVDQWLPNVIGALKGAATAITGMTVAWGIYTIWVKKAAVETALLLSVQTLQSIFALARGITTLSEAMALLTMAIPGGALLKLAAGAATVAAGFIGWKMATSGASDATEQMTKDIATMEAQLKNAADTGSTVPTVLTNTGTAMSDTATKARDLIIEQMELTASARAIKTAYETFSPVVAAHAEEQAKLEEEIAKATAGMTAQQAASVRLVMSHRNAAQSAAAMAKSVAEITARGKEDVLQLREEATMLGKSAEAQEELRLSIERNRAVRAAYATLEGAALKAQLAAIAATFRQREANLQAAQAIAAHAKVVQSLGISQEELTDAIAESVKAVEEQLAAWKKAAQDAQQNLTKPFESAMESIQRAMGDGFARAFKGGKDAAREFAGAVGDIFTTLISGMLAGLLLGKLKPMLEKTFAPKEWTAAERAQAAASAATNGAIPMPKARYSTTANALGGAFVGMGVGSYVGAQTENKVLGALGGAAGGAAAGFAVGGPVGAIAGGITGFVSGLLSSGKAAAEHARAINAATMQLQQQVAAFTLAPTGASADAIRTASRDLQKRIGEQYNAGAFGSTKQQSSADAANREMERVRQAEARKLRELASSVTDDITKAYNDAFGTPERNVQLDMTKWLNERLAALGELVDAGLMSPEARQAAEDQAMAVALRNIQNATLVAQYNAKSEQVGLQARIGQNAPGAADTAARDAQLLAFEKELLDARMKNASPEILAMITAAQEADKAALEQRIAERKRAAAVDAEATLLELTGRKDEAAMLRLLEAQRLQYQDAVLQGLDAATLAAIKLGQAAQTAALAAEQAEARTQAWLSQLNQQFSVFGTSKQDQLGELQKLFGFEGKSREEILAAFTKYTPGQDLTDAQKRTNDHIAELIRLMDAIALEQSSGAGTPNASAATGDEAGVGGGGSAGSPSAGYAPTAATSQAAVQVQTISLAEANSIVSVLNIHTSYFAQMTAYLSQLAAGSGAPTTESGSNPEQTDNVLGRARAVKRIGLGYSRS